MPGGLHGRFVGEHQHAFPVHRARQLIGSECLAKSHLGVPQELGCLGFVSGAILEIRCRLLHRVPLLRPHREGFGSFSIEPCTGACGMDRCLHFIQRALEPFSARAPYSLCDERGMHVAIAELAAVRAQGGFFKQDRHALQFWICGAELLLDPCPGSGFCGFADLDQACSIQELASRFALPGFGVFADYRVGVDEAGHAGVPAVAGMALTWDSMKATSSALSL